VEANRVPCGSPRQNGGYPNPQSARPGAAPSRIDSDAYHALEATYQPSYCATTLLMVSTGATDMSFLRSEGVQRYGVGAMTDLDDAAKGFGPHRARKPILEKSVYQHVPFFEVTSISGMKPWGG